MNRKLICALLLVVASCGCRACDCSCDYLPPVLDGPYSNCCPHGDFVRVSQRDTSTPIAEEPITPLVEQE